MKNLILFLLISLVAWSCSNNNDDSPDGYPSTSPYLFDFIKSDGTNFDRAEVQLGFNYSTIQNDTIFGNNTWSYFLIHEVDENMQVEGQPPVNSYLYFEKIHPAYINELPDGSEWTMTSSNLFKYEGLEDIDEFTVKHSGKFFPNTREVEYWHQEFYLNGEPFEPFYGHFFRIEK
jgi:hypothetical protein